MRCTASRPPVDQVNMYCEMKRTKDAQLVEEVHALRSVCGVLEFMKVLG